MTDYDVFKSICRTDFYAFLQKAFAVMEGEELVPNWHLELICDRLICGYTTDSYKHLIINIAPRTLKSFTISVAYVAFLLGQNPKLKIICVSYGEELAKELSRKTKNLMESSFYKDIFSTRIGNKNTEDFFETTEGGYRCATSTGGALTGRGADVIIVDDPLKADDALSRTHRTRVNSWFANTLVTRLNDKRKGQIILVMQRLHTDDLSGFMLKTDPDVNHLNLPAIANEDEKFILSTGRIFTRKKNETLIPQRESIEDLNKLKATMNEFNFYAQYQQNPIPEQGNIIDFADFKKYNISQLPHNGEIFLSWDIALKDGINNDFSVCIVGKYINNFLYIIEILRGKWEINELINKIHYMASLHNASHVIIEESSISMHLLQLIEKQGKIIPYKYKTQGVSKEVRANSAEFYVKEGRVFLPDNADWLMEFRNEINSFPFGKNDDQVDALTQLISVVFDKKPHDICAIAHAMNNYQNTHQKPANGFSSAKEMCEFAKKYIHRSKPSFWKGD